MKVVEPAELTLNSTTVAASSLNEWASGTAYTAGDQVKVSTESDGTTPIFPVLEFEATGATTGDYPPTASADQWVALGAQNAHRMFDLQNNSATTNAGAITVEVAPSGTVGAVALLGLANVAEASVSVEVDGSEVYANSKTLGGATGTVGWWAYFFGGRPAYTKPSAVWYFPAALSPTITVTLGGSGTLSCAQCLMGLVSSLGETIDGPRPRLRSFSRKEFDENLGASKFVSRSNVRQADFDLLIDSEDFDAVYQRMETLIDVLALYDGNSDTTDFDSLRLYGWVDEFEPELRTPSTSTASLRIQGIE